MDIPKKLIIDIEGKNSAIGCIFVDDSEKVKVVYGGKRLISVTENERDFKIHKLLEINCDLIFCTTQILDDFSFYPVPAFSIFAVDSKENCFGTIDGNDENYVGYVNCKGMYGKIANSINEFLELVVFYPYWQDVMRCEITGESYDLKAIEIGKKENDLQYLAHQREIEETLKICKNPKSIELLISNLKSKQEFIVYSSKEEAQKTNEFLDIHFDPMEMERMIESIKIR